MRSHIELRTQANIEAGMNPEEARYAALRQFGWTESIKETCRDQRSSLVTRHLSPLLQDVRYGARPLRKNPGFTAVACLCEARRQAVLTLGIGTNTANSIPSSPFQAGKAIGRFHRAGTCRVYFRNRGFSRPGKISRSL